MQEAEVGVPVSGCYHRHQSNTDQVPIRMLRQGSGELHGSGWRSTIPGHGLHKQQQLVSQLSGARQAGSGFAVSASSRAAAMPL